VVEEHETPKSLAKEELSGGFGAVSCDQLVPSQRSTITDTGEEKREGCVLK
jgi:hypothetical protein